MAFRQPRTPRHRAHRRIRRAPSSGVLGTISLVMAASVVAGGIHAGVTGATWWDEAPVNAASISAGSTGILLDGQTDLALVGLDALALGPGLAVAAPVTVQNVGTTAVHVQITSGVVLADSQGLAAELMLTVGIVAAPAGCTTSVVALTSGRPSGFSSTLGGAELDAGESLVLCLVLALDGDAPPSTQNGAASFRLTVSGTQVPL